MLDKVANERQVVDPVWLMKEYKIKVYSIEDAINFHKEIARPEIFDNSAGWLQVRFTLDMRTTKKVI